MQAQLNNILEKDSAETVFSAETLFVQSILPAHRFALYIGSPKYHKKLYILCY